MRRLGLVGLATLLATGCVLLLWQQTRPDDASGFSDGFDDALDGSSGTMPAPEGPQLRSGAAAAGATPPPSDDVPAVAATPGPGELLVLSAETLAPLAEVEVKDADGALVGRTKDDGLMQLELVPVGGVDVRAMCAGFLPSPARLKPNGRVVVQLVPGVPVSGHIVRPGTHGYPGIARVFVLDEDLRKKIVTFSTDETGAFRIPAVRPNRPFLMTIEFVDLVPRTVRLVVDAPTDDLEVVVDAGGLLSGRVLDERGRAMPDVDVRLLPRGELIFEQRRFPRSTPRAAKTQIVEDTPTTRTDGYGKYAFHGVKANRMFEVVAVLRPRCEARSKPVLFAQASEKLERDVHVPAMTSLRVRVQSERGEALDDVKLTFESSSGPWTIQPDDTREDDGDLLLQHLTPGTVTIKGFRPAEPIQSETVTLEAGREAQVTLQFPSGATVAGVVQNKRGKPIANARVRWLGSEPLEVRTATDGRFEFRSGAPRGMLSISARGREHVPFGYETTVFEDLKPGIHLDVVLLDGTRATGEFKDLPEGATVSSAMFPGGEADETLLELDDDLRFERRGAPAGSGALFVFRTRGFPPLLHRERIPFRSEEVRDLGQLAFETTDPRMGRVIGEGRKPVWAAKVSIEAPWSRATRRTDRKGHFEFVNLPRVTVRLRIEAEGYPTHHVNLRTRSEEHRQVFFISSQVWVRFDFVDEAANKVGHTELTLVRLGGKTKFTGTRKADHAGRLHWYLEPGQYRIRTRIGKRHSKPTGDDVIEITREQSRQVVRLTIK